jgi:hypothetical protein
MANMNWLVRPNGSQAPAARKAAKTYILNLKLSTADGTMLHFPDDIQESEQITAGVGPVKLDNNQPAEGEWTMPDGTTIIIDKKGYVTEIKEPSTEDKMTNFRKDAASIRAEIGRMAEAAGIKLKPKPKPKVEAPKVRQAFKAKRKPTGKRQPFHKPCK